MVYGMKSDRIDFRIPQDLRARLREWVDRQDFPMTESAAIRYAILSLLKFSDRVRREEAPYDPEADARDSYDLAVREIGAKVKAGAPRFGEFAYRSYPCHRQGLSVYHDGACAMV